MITCDGCYMDALHDNDDERARCIGRRICIRAHQQGRADLLIKIRECAKHLGYDDIDDLLSYVELKEQKE